MASKRSFQVSYQPWYVLLAEHELSLGTADTQSENSLVIRLLVRIRLSHPTISFFANLLILHQALSTLIWIYFFTSLHEDEAAKLAALFIVSNATAGSDADDHTILEQAEVVAEDAPEF